MFISARVIKQPNQPWKLKASLSAWKKPSNAFLRNWAAINRFCIDDSMPTSTDGEQ